MTGVARGGLRIEHARPGIDEILSMDGAAVGPDCVLAKVTHDFAGHYNRADVFTLVLNDRVPQIFQRRLAIDRREQEADAATGDGGTGDLARAGESSTVARREPADNLADRLRSKHTA